MRRKMFKLPPGAQVLRCNSQSARSNIFQTGRHVGHNNESNYCLSLALSRYSDRSQASVYCINRVSKIILDFFGCT